MEKYSLQRQIYFNAQMIKYCFEQKYRTKIHDSSFGTENKIIPNF